MYSQASCANTKAAIDYLRANGVKDIETAILGLDPAIDALDDPLHFLTDPNNWVSTVVLVKLYDRVRTRLNDPRAGYKIAQFAIQNGSLGYLQKVAVKVFFSPRNGLKHIQRINDKFSRTKRIELLELGRNSALIRLHWYPELVLSKDLCLYNQGLYAYVPTIWVNKPLDIEETCCYFKGARYCEFRLHWPLAYRFRQYFSRFYTSRAMLKDIIAEQEKDKELIVRKYEEVNQLNLELSSRLKQLLALQATGKAILSILEQERLLTAIMAILARICKIHRAMIMLVNDNEGCLTYLHGWGFEGPAPEWLKNYRVPLDRLENLMARVAHSGREGELREVHGADLRKENFLSKADTPISILAVPLITDEKVIGVIAIDAPAGRGISTESRETLKIFAPHMAIAIENAKLYSRLKVQVEALKRSQALLSRAEKFSFLGHLAALLAHEIKNPMTAIGTFVQMLPRKMRDEQFLHDFYEIGMEEVGRVNTLITELLDLTRSKESHYEPCDPRGLIEKIALLLSPQTHAKRIRVRLELDRLAGPFWMDPEKVKQVILNLLSNAVEFTPDEGQLEVITKKAAGTDGQETFILEIKNSGPAIDPALIGRIFDPYFTTRHESSIRKGTGLGLFIAQKNIQDQGGTIDVVSGKAHGTCFTVTLPLRTQPPRPAEPA